MLSLFGLASSAGQLLFTDEGLAIAALAFFVVAYMLVVTEDLIHLRKSKPVVLAAGLIWICVSLVYHHWAASPEYSLEVIRAHTHSLDIKDVNEGLEAMIGHHVAEFAQLFLFLLVAMTYISAISERNVFLWLNAWLVSRGFGLRAVFWVTGLLAFLISPVADNLTTALLMGAVVVTVGRGKPGFIAAACTNVVVAANAGGAFSPFGDITTLMVWQKGHVSTFQFLELVPASLVAWLLPAAVMHFALPKDHPEPVEQDAELKSGWWVVILLFLMTIATAVAFHAFLHLPPFLGMMLGLCYLFLYGYYRTLMAHRVDSVEPVDVLRNVADVEWDTMLFFFGVIMCVGGLTELGFLAVASEWLYDPNGPVGALWANISVGLISAVLDNVPVMFAVLAMGPEMDLTQWLLVTLTAGIGGSLLSVGSAAGVALMGTAHGYYTFVSHLKWTLVIGLGYAAAIALHMLLFSSAASR